MLYTSNEDSGLIKVLQFLKAHQMEYLSGEDLSEVLKISRVAIWKHIKKIQSLGYKIESKQNLGYRLTETTDLVLPWEVTEGLKTKSIGSKVYYFDSIDSTQNFATKLSRQGNEAGSVVVAKTQSSGRGRMSRKWISPKGGIWLSVVISPTFDISKMTLVPFAAAIAISRAIQKTLGKKTELKWPNDVTLNGKKIAGVIIDASIESSKIESLVLGVGINYRIKPADVEKRIKPKHNYYGVETLVRNGEQKPAKLVKAFLEELENALEQIESGRTHSIISQWTKMSSTIGREISVNTANGKIRGTAAKLDDEGSLVIKHDSEITKVSAGDVIYG